MRDETSPCETGIVFEIGALEIRPSRIENQVKPHFCPIFMIFAVGFRAVRTLENAPATQPTSGSNSFH